MGMRLDLDELERKALAIAAISADIDLTDNDVTLALIARIRELEAALSRAIGEFAQNSEDSDDTADLRVLLAKGVTLP